LNKRKDCLGERSHRTRTVNFLRRADIDSAESFDPASKTIVSFSQLPKNDAEIVSTDAGIQIDCSDEQFRKGESPRLRTFEPDSNVKLESFRQERKQYPPIDVVDEGMQID
jgi:hypothetical protein